MPLVLPIFASVCALPATKAAIPSAIAQEEENNSSDDEDLASSIVSDVIDGDNDEETNGSGAQDESNQDATNTATEGSNQEQEDEDNAGEFGDDESDLDNTNVAIPIAIPIIVDIIEEDESPTSTPPVDDGQLPEDILFCVESREGGGNVCFDTRADCEFFRLDVEITDQCEREETLLPMLICVIM